MRNWNLSKGYKIYFNLHKRCFSIQAWDKDKKGWRLYKHATSLYVENVYTQVSEVGRQRVIKEKRKNVHSFLRVDKMSINQSDQKFLRGIVNGPFHQICKYNPYKYGYFYDDKEEFPIHFLPEAILQDGVIYYNKTLQPCKTKDELSML